MKEELLNRMIAIYGFEHECVLGFAYLMDKLPLTALTALVEAHEEHPLIEEEE